MNKTYEEIKKREKLFTSLINITVMAISFAFLIIILGLVSSI